jgi:hypothetical protein
VGLGGRVLLGGLPLLAIMAAGSWTLLLLLCVLVIPKFLEIFRDFGVALPGLTAMLLSFGRWLAGETPGQVVPGALMMVPVIVMMWGLVPLSVIRSTRMAATVIAVVLLLLAGVFLLVGAAALAVPLVAMIESMQGGGAV